jgi:hypothetical protein
VEQIRDIGFARRELARVFGHGAAGHAMLRRVGVQSDMEERLVKLRFALVAVLPTVGPKPTLISHMLIFQAPFPDMSAMATSTFS